MSGFFAAALAAPGAAHAAGSAPPGLAGIATALMAHLDHEAAQQAAEQLPLQPPPVVDPEGGPVISILGGSIFSGASAFQTGGALAYFFGPKASFGFEAEGTITFGPGGRVSQLMGSFVVQTGARTSKFVPYLAIGGGFLRATTELPTAKRAILTDLGIDPQPQTENAPFFQMGGGVRFFIRPNLAFRADARFSQVALDLEGLSLAESRFPMRRVAGMLSWNF